MHVIPIYAGTLTLLKKVNLTVTSQSDSQTSTIGILCTRIMLRQKSRGLSINEAL